MQFSLKQLFLAVTCLALAAAAYRDLLTHEAVPGEMLYSHRDDLAAFAILVFPCIAVYILTKRIWPVFLVAGSIFVFVIFPMGMC